VPPARGKTKSYQHTTRGFTAPIANLPMEVLLLGLGAAALDQNKQNDNRQYATDNLNDRGSFHIDSSFLQ